MYHYIYDPVLSEKRYGKFVVDLENRLTDLGIHGRIDRIHPFKSLREAVEEHLKRGGKTVVAVGTDETFKRVLEVVVGKPLTLGYIPISGIAPIAQLLGIPEGVAACDMLSARLTETLDIGRVNGQYFFAAVSFSGKDVSLECEGRYRVELVAGGKVSICNVGLLEGDGMQHQGNPFDGYLEAILEPAAASGGFFRKAMPLKQSVLSLRKIIARSPKPFTVVADGRILSQQERAEIDIAKERLRVIIGKTRMIVPTVPAAS